MTNIKDTFHFQGGENRFFFFYLTKLKSVILPDVYRKKSTKNLKKPLPYLEKTHFQIKVYKQGRHHNLVYG